jgi:hypothetical protein
MAGAGGDLVLPTFLVERSYGQVASPAVYKTERHSAFTYRFGLIDADEVHAEIAQRLSGRQ